MSPNAGRDDCFAAVSRSGPVAYLAFEMDELHASRPGKPGYRFVQRSERSLTHVPRLAIVRSWRRHPTVRGNAHGNGMATKWRFR
jgi:hypothetical protein